MAGAAAATILRHIRRWARPGAAEEADGALLDRFLEQHDEEAFGALLQRHGRMVYNVCVRILRDEHRAEDAFQAAFLLLARKGGTIRNRDAVASWLYGVAYRLAVRAKTRPTCQLTSANEGVAMTEPDPAHAAAWRELRPLVDEAVAALPEKYRTLLLLCYFEGKSSDEAARLLQLPSGTAKSRLARGRDLLRQRLLHRGLTLATGTLAACLAGPAMAAPLPSTMFEPTVQAAMSVAAGAAVPAGIVSAQAAALYRGELLAMFMSHLKSATALALVAGVTFGSTFFGLARADKPLPTELPAAAAAAELPAVKADAKAAAAASPFEGRWTAKLEFNGKNVMTRIEIVTEDGKLKGVARPSKDASYELQKLTVNGAKISFDVDTGNAEISIKGELKDGAIAGSMEVLTKNEGLVEGTFTMTRPQ